MVDTPDNLRKAAFDGEVVDIELSRAVDASELAFLAQIEGVISGPDKVTARMWRLVVDDADDAIQRLDEQLERLQLPIIETREHFVDFDEAFVRVIERHRSVNEDADNTDDAELAEAG
jgi:hypothetical protein